MLPQPHMPTSALHRLPHSSTAVVLSMLLLVKASQPDRVPMPAHHCSNLLPAGSPNADEWGAGCPGFRIDSYVLPGWQYLPSRRQSDVRRSPVADMLACSYPSPQHDPGESSDPVIPVVLEMVLSGPFLKTLPGQN